jgi:hypothetical protein
LEVHAAGFNDARVEVKIGSKGLSPLRIILPIATQTETVNVGLEDAAPQVVPEVSENQNANTMDRDALDRVPVFDQDYVATMSRFLSDDAIGTNGVSLVVNGIEANRPGVSASAIQEVKINQNPYSALFARPGRARLEITTKGGTPDFHGAVNFLFRDAVFDAKNAFQPAKGPEKRQYYEGSLTGPVFHSKQNTFLLSLERDADDLQAAVDAIGPNGPVIENVPQPNRHFFSSLRFFHDFANGDQFWMGYSFENETKKNQGVGGIVLPQAAFTSKSTEHEINVSYRHLFSPKLINQLRFLVGHNDEPVISADPSPQIVVLGTFVGGGAQADSKRTESHFDGADIVSYSSGKHQINFGVDTPDLSRRGADDFTNRGGTYTFSSLQNLIAKNADSFTIQKGQGHLVFWERNAAGFAEDTMRLRANFSVTLGLRYYYQNYFHDKLTNFAPRFGFAYAPTKKSKTVLRGGAGLFFDRSGPRPIADLLHFNGVNLFRFIATNVSFPVDPALLSSVPPGIVILDPRLRIPRNLQYSFGIERQLSAKSTFSVTYVGSRGMDLFRSRDINAPAPPNYATRPNAALGQVRQIESEGYQKGNSLEVNFRGKQGKYFAGQAQYTLSKTYNNTGGIRYFPADSYFPALDWARSDNDRRHKFDLLGSTELIKYFSVGLALSAYSGKPVNVTSGIDTYHTGLFNERQLPTGIILARNAMHGPGLLNLDVNLQHEFKFGKSKDKKESRSLTLALNAFNVLNHVNDVTFVGVLSSANFGRATQALPARRIQLNAEFKF